MKAILNRFAEPSSYAGLAGVLAAVGVNVPSPTVQAGIYIMSGVCGLIAFFLPG